MDSLNNKKTLKFTAVTCQNYAKVVNIGFIRIVQKFWLQINFVVILYIAV